MTTVLKLSSKILKSPVSRWKEELKQALNEEYPICLKLIQYTNEANSFKDLQCKLYTECSWHLSMLRSIIDLIKLAKLKYLFGYPVQEYMQHIQEFVWYRNKFLGIITKDDISLRGIPVAEYDVLDPYKSFERVEGMLTPYHVSHTLYFAIILGNKELLNSLLSFPEWKYPFDNGGAIYTPGYVEYFRALKCICAQNYKKASNYLEAFSLIVTNTKWKKNEEYSKKYLMCKVKILQAIVQREQETFNSTLTEYIEANKKLAYGTLPVELLFMEDALAYTILAQQNQMIPVDSVYVPKELLH